MRTTASDPILQRLSVSDDTASLGLLAQLCRQSPRLRHWLWEDFGRDAATRSRFAALVKDAAAPLPARFADVTGEAKAWQTLRQSLRADLPSEPYGGLACAEIERLIRHYQAGTLDLGTFLLVHHWRESSPPSPVLLWAGLQLLESSIPSRQWRHVKQLGKAFAFLRQFENKKKRRSVVGFSDWWKVQVLLYILRNPSPVYRTRDLRAHLPGPVDPCPRRGRARSVRRRLARV